MNKRLLNLVKNEEWTLASELLSETAKEQSSSTQHDDDDHDHDKDSGIVATGGNTSTSTSTTTSTIRELVTAYDSSGQIPLHISIWKKAPAQFILSLISYDETTVTTKTKNQSTPLHFATFYSSPYAILETLVKLYPLALDEVNEFGVTPRTYDMGKYELDIRAKELLTKPTSYWMEVYIHETMEERSLLRQMVHSHENDVLMYKQRYENSLKALQQSKLREKECMESMGVMETKLATCETECRLVREELRSRDSYDHYRRRAQRLSDEDVGGGGGRPSAATTRTTTGVATEEEGGEGDCLPPALLASSSDSDYAASESSSSSSSSPSSSSTADVIIHGRRPAAGEEQGATMISPSASPSPNNVECVLEKRIQFLEEKLSDAIDALDRKITLTAGKGSPHNDVVVDDGWVITSKAGGGTGAAIRL